MYPESRPRLSAERPSSVSGSRLRDAASRRLGRLQAPGRTGRDSSMYIQYYLYANSAQKRPEARGEPWPDLQGSTWAGMSCTGFRTRLNGTLGTLQTGVHA